MANTYPLDIKPVGLKPVKGSFDFKLNTGSLLTPTIPGTDVPLWLSKIDLTENLDPKFLKSKIPPIDNPNNFSMRYVGAGLQGLTAGMNNYFAIDSSPVENQLKQAEEGTQFTALDNSNLMSQWTNYTPEKTDYNIQDMGFDWGEQIGNTLSATASGAATGGIPGAIIGFVGGLAGNIVGGLTANNKAKEAEDEAKRINLVNQNKFLNQVNTVDYNNDLLMKRNSFAEGGTMNLPEGLSFINEGGTHEQNPFGGVPMGVAEDGSQNLVEEGEVIYNDYVFSNRLEVPQELKDKYKIKDKVITFADAVKYLLKPYEDNMEDPINKRGIEAIMQNFTLAQEELRMKEQNKNKKKLNSNEFPDGGWMKYAPIGANILGLTQNIFTPYDLEYADKIETSAKRIPGVKANLISGKLPFTPNDNRYLLAKQIAESNASRSGLLNMSPNAGAGRASILASDYNTLNTLGEIALKNLAEDRAARLQNAQYNLGIDQYNAQALDKAAAIDAELEKYYQDSYLKNLMISAAMRSQEKTGRTTSIGTNLTTLADNLHQLAKEEETRDRVNLVLNKLEGLDAEAIEALTKFGAGGKINRKKRKGLTY
jgi:hypothetical protein